MVFITTFSLVVFPQLTFAAHWDNWRDEGCSKTSYGSLVKVARIWGIPHGHSWEDYCRDTPTTIHGTTHHAFHCQNVGGLGMLGYFNVQHSRCMPYWDRGIDKGCRGIFKVYHAHLANVPADFSWEVAGAKTMFSWLGYMARPPNRLMNQHGVEMWGEWLVPYEHCGDMRLVGPPRLEARGLELGVGDVGRFRGYDYLGWTLYVAASHIYSRHGPRGGGTRFSLGALHLSDHEDDLGRFVYRMANRLREIGVAGLMDQGASLQHVRGGQQLVVYFSRQDASGRLRTYKIVFALENLTTISHVITCFPVSDSAGATVPRVDLLVAGGTSQPAAFNFPNVCIWQSYHCTFMRANGHSVDLAPAAQAWEQWACIPRGGNRFAWRSQHNGRYLRALPDGRVDTHDKLTSWGIWTVTRATTNTGYVGNNWRSAHGTYLRAGCHGEVNLAPQPREWESWRT
jgi:hypothetical protein